jgi:hypothetical protein
MKLKLVAGLVVALALSLSSVAGASASAKLCSTKESPCSAAHTYAPGTTVTANINGNLTVVNKGFVNYTCAQSTVGGEVTSEGIAIKSVSFKSCSSSQATFTLAGTKLPWSATASAGTEGNGSLTIGSVSLKETINGIPCEFAASSVPLAVTGGAPARFKINAKFPKVGGCSLISELELIGEYLFTAPSSLYIEA